MIKKEEILAEARQKVKDDCLAIGSARSGVKAWLESAKKRFRKLSGVDRLVEERLMATNQRRVTELGYLEGSPYFVRCDLQMGGKDEVDTLYFGKFNFSEGGIYSWVAPASAVRYESPGAVQYRRPDASIQHAKLIRKDQFMIANGQIKFMSSESADYPRELIYQDHFSERKSGFVLPEIVAQMEKAQDQVIRAHHIGPLAISGPAGSGKTTLALHRIAYLLQSPDLEDIFSGESMLVLVQDKGTKDYFSALLPGLGIDNVTITTFPEWALSVLPVEGKYEPRIGKTEDEADSYEYAKLSALKNGISNLFNVSKAYDALRSLYGRYFNEHQKAIFARQEHDGIFDSIDLSILLMAYNRYHGKLGRDRDYYVQDKKGVLKKKHGFVPLNYSLILVDEFQNYLPSQLKLIKTCISNRTRSMIYVGDMAQQVRLGTVKDFEEIGEDIDNERRVVLQKVYRNTKKILEYVRKCGYDVEIPDGLKEGEPVCEHLVGSQEEGVEIIKKILKDKKYQTVGILGRSIDDLAAYEAGFSDVSAVHVMTMRESQGVEFDIVFLVGVGKESLFAENEITDIELARELGKISRDLFYVALTRAIFEMHLIDMKS